MTWIPDPAPIEMEKKMEEQDIPESDRDEVRKLAEFLRRKQARKEGKELPPMPEEMKNWLLGKE